MFDSPIDRHRRTKKSLLPFWLLIVTILIVFGYCLYATVGPNPPIIVSKSTTHLTAPLGKDGLPDYAAVLLADTMKGVTPETNAAVPLVEALVYEGTDWDTLSQNDLKLLYDTIGATWPPDPSLRLEALEAEELRIEAVRLLRERIPRPQPDSEVEAVSEDEEAFNARFIDDLFWSMSVEEAAAGPAAEYYHDQMYSRPWSSDDLPFLAKWFDDNNKAIDRLASGFERSAWALPQPSWVRHTSDPTEWLGSFAISAPRSTARLLSARSMYRAGEQKWEASRREALGILKLAAYVSEGHLLLDQLVAGAIYGIGISTVNQLSLTPDVPADELRLLLSEFDAIGTPLDFARAFDQGERYFMLASIVRYRLSESLSDTGIEQLSFFSIDWNPAMRRMNKLYNQAIAAAKTAGGRARQNAIRAVDAEFQAVNNRLDDQVLQAKRKLTPSGRGELAADILMTNTMMSFEHAFAIESRWRTQRELTRTVIALAIYRAEHDEYPSSLKKLVPDMLQIVPTDPVFGDPLGYRKTDDGFLVYSIGFNGVDDGGSNDGEAAGFGRQVYEGIFIDEQSDPTEAANLTAKIPKCADDLSLRAPLPIKPWPWEKAPGDSSPPASVESSPGD